MKKRNISYRISALILSLVLLLGSVPVGAYASEPAVVQTEQESAKESEESGEQVPVEMADEVKGQNPVETADKADEQAPVEKEEEPEEVPVEKEEESEETEKVAGAIEQKKFETNDESEKEDALEAAAGQENPEEQFHFAEGDIAGVMTWRDKYMPGGYGDLLSCDKAWWDNLYDHERDLADFLVSLIEESSEDIYVEQDLEESIHILESGVSPESFFAGTVYEGIGLEDLYFLKSAGYSLQDVYDFLMAACGEGDSGLYDIWLESDGEPEDGNLDELARIVERLLPSNPMLYANNGDQVAKMSVSKTGYSGTGHGDIYRLTVGGEAAFCLSMGKSARSTYLYNAEPGTYEVKNEGLGVLISLASPGTNDYVCVQIAIWIYQRGSSYSKEQVIDRATAMLDISSEEAVESMVSSIWAYYRLATQGTKTYYIFYSDNSNAQVIGTKNMPSTFTYEGGESGGETTGGGEYSTASVSAEASDQVDVEAKVTIVKRDNITEEALEGAKIRINGKTYTSNSAGKVTHTEEDSCEASATGPEYTYVVDWDSLTEGQRADADSKGYYHSRDAAYRASRGEANAQVQEELDEWADSWRADFDASETAPPYGYNNNGENVYETTCKDGAHKSHDFRNKPWEVWLKVTKHDSVTGQTDFSLADAEFSVYEYDRSSGDYRLYRYQDRQIMKDNQDGTYAVGPLYYNPANQGKFMILETRSPYGYTIDQTTNRFYFEITGENQITCQMGNPYNTSGTYQASQTSPHDFQAYNEPWKVKVEAYKVDEDTGSLLSGVRFDVLRFHRESNDYVLKTLYSPSDIQVNERLDGSYVSDWIYWNYENQGKFYLVESEARKGYFGDWKERILELITGHPAGWQDDDANGKNAYYFQITGSRIEEGIIPGYNNQTTVRASANEQGTIANERTKGRVTVVKYDTESESTVTQGDTSLEGAVYELRAAENIMHADGRTGIIYHKGELILTGTIGKTPVLDKYGYVLNTDGKRYCTYGGEIRYRETPGEFSFYNIELGKYTLKEIKASPGYMLDETTYELTFTYDDETGRVILRDEASRDDKNTLTVDDGNTENETVYSGDYVQKQAFSLVKTSDNQFQTELVPVEGAGFTVYLVSELQKVKSGELSPANGQSWSDLDIREFYDYDFSNEQPATVYKRDLEKWTQGDRNWLWKVQDGNPNEYRVSEMFTDKKGALTSPELPYGTYVVVETTVPKGHVMARPFFVNVTLDGGVVYTDATRQTIAKTFSERTDIRYGDHENENIYRDEKVWNKDVVEGRLAQETRYISDNQTESYLRLVKADTDFLPPSGSVLKPEEMVSGTVLKGGARYRIKIVSMTDREFETFTKTGWKKDGAGYIWYYETSSRKEYGTLQTPFAPTVLRNEKGGIVDCYLTLPAQLPTGSYEVTELSAPSGYVLNGREQKLEDTGADGRNVYEIVDAPQNPIRFTLDNTSVYPEGQMGEHKYTLRDSYGNIVCTVLQDNQEQKGILELIKHGEQLYRASNENGAMLKEKLDTSYFRPIWKDLAYTAKDYEFIYEDAPIGGAVFEIYAAEDIYTQELDASMLDSYGVNVRDHLVWSRDEKVGTITTDDTGYAYLAGLYIGKYYIRETYAGEGFVLDQELQKFEITAQEPTVNFEWVQSIWENQRQGLKVQVQKQDVEDHTPLSGAIYGLYCKEDICSFIVENPDKTVPAYRHIQWIPDYTPEDAGRLLIPADTLVATAVTDEQGIADFGDDLPLGKYYVKELEAPLGYTHTDQREEIDGSWQGQNVDIQDHTDIVFKNQRTRHVFTKSDMVSGVHIGGAYLEVWEILLDEKGNLQKNPDSSYMLADEPADTWVSKGAGEEIHYFYEDNGFYCQIASPDDLPQGKDLIVKEGHLLEKLTAGRQYVLRETLAPENYVGYEASSKETKEANREVNQVTEEVMFIVKDDNMVIEHDMKDQRTVGTFSVTKEGEFFVGTKEGLRFTDKVKNLFVTIFNYVLGRVENTSFEVYVREDIFTPDGTGNYVEWTNGEGRTVMLKKDTLIETITTGQSGLATVNNLPLGTYYLRETAAGDGAFLVNRDEKEVTLSYVDQNTPVVFSDSIKYVNARQRISIQIHKMEAGTTMPVKEAVFGLYAGEDLHGYVVNEDRVVSTYPVPYVEKDTLLETTETDEEGLAHFQADVPNGKYYVREIQAPEGYLKTDEIWYCDASYGGEHGDKCLTFSWDVYNTVSDVTVSKQDLTNGEEIAGASLEILEESTGQVVDHWISEKRPHRAGGIQISDEQEHIYILRETLPAAGYVTAEQIRFYVQEKEGRRKVWVCGEEGWNLLDDRCIVMKDDVTKADFIKTGPDGKAPLAGASLQLLDEQGKEAAAWISKENPYSIERLPIGTYTLRELKAPKGYRKAADMEVEIRDTSKIQTFIMIDEKAALERHHTGFGGDESSETILHPVIDIPSPLTGDAARLTAWGSAALALAAALVWMFRKW